ncbi:unnamed protein product [Schistosoma curassoni]|uniref:Uncharacterized protein n=1 Tax=Schistosoma curassoni TaxID=6186 RepID=A0A183JDU1_9TREM|nr:unnamed protein product [Schistosoma curassoni]
MVVGGSRQETLDPSFVLLGTRQHGVPATLRGLVLPGGFGPVSPIFTVHLSDRCQVARKLGSGFPVDYLQPPSHDRNNLSSFLVR